MNSTEGISRPESGLPGDHELLGVRWDPSGRVVLARDPLDDEMAITYRAAELLDDGKVRVDFRAEAQLLAEIDTPNVAIERTGSPAVSRKVVEGLRRYGPLELAATAATLLGAYATYRATGSAAAAAVAGTVAENVGYYGAAGLRSSSLWYRALPHISPRRRAWTSFWRAVRATMIEFGPAEIVSLLIRPPLLYTIPLLLGNMGAGWMIGKFAADIVFYAMAFFSFEKARHLIVPSAAILTAVR